MSRAVVRRCHDPATIERILREDAIDEPILSFTPSLLKRAVNDLLAPSPQVFFVTVDWDERPAGFVFGHTLGPMMWRRFARKYFTRHPAAIAYVVWRLRVTRPARHWLKRRTARRQSTGAKAAQPLTVPRVDRPFSWSSSESGAGQVDQLFVRSEFRGLGLAPMLLHGIVDAMARDGVSLIEAHVDPGNFASLRAFLKAGWDAYETAGHDFYVSCRPDREPPQPADNSTLSTR